MNLRYFTMNVIRVLLFHLFRGVKDCPRPGESNSFRAVGHIYVPEFYTGQTLLKKKFISVVTQETS